jgi:pimeloyl-ACP methyl ester carboxylesterase
MTTVKCAYADSSLGQIHLRHRAGKGTPIVFLHQTASSSAMYVDVMNGLSINNPLYAFDTPGFGGSPDPEDKTSMRQYANWLLEAINFCGIDSFHLFGHHTGVCIAAEIENMYPDRVKSLMMIGPVPLTKDEREEFRKYYSTPMSPTADGSYLKQTWDYLKGLGAHSNLQLHQRELVDTIRAYMGRFLAYSAVWDQDFTSLYEKIQCPLLLMCAPDDVLIDFFQRAKEIRPDAHAVELLGANFEPDQDPDGVIKAIESFLEKHDK